MVHFQHPWGVQYILIFVENFTKYVKLYKLERATTKVAINKVIEYVGDKGKPNYIPTDNGTQFTARMWKKEKSYRLNQYIPL